MLDAQLLSDRRGEKAIGGGDDRDERRVALVPGHQRAPRGQDAGPDRARHIPFAPGEQPRHGVRHEGAQAKAHEFERACGPFIVAVRHVGVGRFFRRPVDGPHLDEEVEPLDVAVAVEQRVVQVEKDEFPHPAQAATWSGAVRVTPIALSASAIAAIARRMSCSLT